MTTSINFLRQRKKELEAAVVEDRKYMMWMSYVLIGIVIVAVIAVGFDFFLQRSIRSVREEQADVDAQLQQHASVEQTYLTLADKVENIDKILSGRIEKRETLQFFTSLFLTQDLSIKEIGFENPQVLQFNLVSSNVFTLDEALNKLQSDDVQNRFSSISTTDLNRDATGKYSLRVVVGLAVQPTASSSAKTTSSL